MPAMDQKSKELEEDAEEQLLHVLDSSHSISQLRTHTVAPICSAAACS